MANLGVIPSYLIWGTDSLIYGPVELPTLIAWVQEERVLSDTWIFLEHEDKWSRAGSIQELKIVLSKRSGKQSREALESQTGSHGTMDIGLLRKVKIFTGMSDQQLIRFLDFMEVSAFGPYQTIVKQGNPGDAMYILLSGEVRVRILIDGRESTIATLGSGEFFGEISLFDHGPRSADVVSNQDSEVLIVSASNFQNMMHKAPELAAPFLLGVGKSLTTRIRNDNKRLKEIISFKRVSEI